MLKIAVVTLFPQMFEALTAYGVTGRARASGIYELLTFDPRDHTADRHRTVDDYSYGGGPGMVLKYGPVMGAIGAARKEVGADLAVSYLSPQGRRLDQELVHELSRRSGLLLLAGRYEGVDHRVLDACVTEEMSIGDYVLSGGELAAMVLIDTVVRSLPGALGHAESAQADSFVDGLLDYPHYTRPEEVDDRRVPEILLSGDHQAIARWRKKQALGRTWLKRPDLIERRTLSESERSLLDEYISEQ